MATDEDQSAWKRIVRLVAIGGLGLIVLSILALYVAAAIVAKQNENHAIAEQLSLELSTRSDSLGMTWHGTTRVGLIDSDFAKAKQDEFKDMLNELNLETKRSIPHIDGQVGTFLLLINGFPWLYKVLLLLIPLAGIVALLISKLAEGVRATLWLVLFGLIMISFMSSLADRSMAWGWLLASVPAMLVVHHGLYLGLIKPRFGSDNVSKDLSDPVMKERVEANDRYFNPGHLALRYGLSALGIFTIGLTIFACLNPVNEWALNLTLVDKHVVDAPKVLISDATLVAARFGAAGAYLYVLLYLGQRGFRHDITSGASLWCAVTLALGPLLAAAISKMWVTSGQDNGWTAQAVYFAVGMAPRHVARQVEQLAKRLAGGAKPAASDRSVPLTVLSGIAPEVEERLFEEGIYDIGGLAAADPLRLNRSTNFDKTQLLAWIDAAILVYTLPDNWEELKKKGIRGILDLVWHKGHEDFLKALADKDETLQLVLSSVVARMYGDPQVRCLMALYAFNENTPPLYKGEDNGVRVYSTAQMAEYIKRLAADPSVAGPFPPSQRARDIHTGATPG